MAPFTFINTDVREAATREAIKVHVLRRRGRLHLSDRQLRSEAGSRGGQVHIWDLQTHDDTARSLPIVDHSIQSAAAVAVLARSAAPTAHLRKRNKTCHPTTTITLKAVSRLQRGPDPPSDALVQLYLHHASGEYVAQKWVQEFESHAIAFDAFVSLCGFHLFQLWGLSVPFFAREKEIAAIQAVRRQITLTPNSPTLGITIAVALLTNLSEIRLDHAQACVHWGALKSMIHASGGLLHLRRHPELHKYFFWLDALVCNALTTPLGTLTDNSDPVSCTPSEELAICLSRVQARTLSQTGSDVGMTSELLTYALKQPCQQSSIYEAKKICRANMSCLLYFALLKLHIGGDLVKTSVYHAIDMQVKASELHHPMPSPRLFYLLLDVSASYHLYNLVYKVSRLQNALKRVSNEGLKDCGALLANYVGIDVVPNVDLDVMNVE